MFNKTLDYAQAGDNAGALLRGTKREEIERGQVLAKPGSITPHTVFKAEVYVLSKDEGGRHTPFFNGYRPQFYFRTTDVTGSIKLPEGQEMVMPGDNTNMDIELIQPIAMDQGLGSPSVRAGAPWAPASSPRSSSKTGDQPLAATENPHPPQGVRPPAAGPLGPVDSRHRSAQRRDDHRSGAPADGEERLLRDPEPVQGQGLAEHFEVRTHKRLIDIHSPYAEDDRPAHAARSARGRRHRDQALMKGIVGRKLGMTQLFDERAAKVTAVTVIEAGPCPVVQLKTEETDGYEAVQLAFDEVPSGRSRSRASGT
jgi:hypothetical protein